MSQLYQTIQTRIQSNLQKEGTIEFVNGLVYFDEDLEDLLREAKIDLGFTANGAVFTKGKETLILPYVNRPQADVNYFYNILQSKQGKEKQQYTAVPASKLVDKQTLKLTL